MQDTQKPVVTGDTYSYRGWLVSDKFLKRAFAVMGHYMVASLIILIPLYIIIFGAIFAIFGASGMSDKAGEYNRMNRDNYNQTMENSEGGMDMNNPEMQQMMQDSGMK